MPSIQSRRAPGGRARRRFRPKPLRAGGSATAGVMAARVIDSKRDRLTTILVAPLMTCSARIPVYTLIIAAFIPDETVWGFANLQGLVMFGLYAAGIVSARTRSATSKVTKRG